MAKVFIYMNHRIKQKRPRLPVIRVQSEDGTYVEGNMVEIRGPSTMVYDRKGLVHAREHRVVAWVVAEERYVDVK